MLIAKGLRIGGSMVFAIVASVAAALVAAGVFSTSVGISVVGLTAVAGLGLILASDWGDQLLSRISRLSVGPISIELLAEIKAVAVRTRTDDGKDPSLDPSQDIVDLRLKLEAKLAYVAKHLLADATPTFLTIGSLRHDGYLTDAEARTATLLTTLRPGDLSGFSESERAEFLSAADRLAANLRATVFRAMVVRVLRADGWVVTEIARGEYKRPDLEVHKAERSFRVATPFVTPADMTLLNEVAARFRAEGEQAGALSGILVIPNDAQSLMQAEDVPCVVHLDELTATLAR